MEKHWSEQYREYMLVENFEEAIFLKNENFPKSFFKYRHLNERTIENIEQNYIWLAEIGSLNDPFECSIQFDNDKCLREFYGSKHFQTLFKQLTGQSFTKQEIQVLTTAPKPFLEYKKICDHKKIPLGQSPEEQINKVQKRWAEIVTEGNKNLRICSFSLTKSSLLLWSHYSNEHKGICIEYDFLDTDVIRTFMQPVIYKNEVPTVGLLEEYSTMNMIGASLIKSKDWEYEQEWRLTMFRQAENYPQKMTVPNPTAIYLGTRYHLNDDILKDRLSAIAKEKNIPIYQMGKHPQEFRLIETSRFP